VKQMKLHMTKPANPRKHTKPHRSGGPRSSTLTAEEYRTKYLLGGTARLSRLLRYARMLKRDA
jgi:hypothetical protein